MNKCRVYEIKVTRTRIADAPPLPKVASSADVAPLARSLIGNNVTESLLVFSLDAKHKMLGYSEVARGGNNSCAVSPGDIFRPAIVSGATAVILAHNHPSGETAPSHDDVELTRRVVAAGELLGVHVLDHLIVSDSSPYFSFCDKGMLRV